MSDHVNTLAKEILQGCSTPLRAQVCTLQHTCLTTLADNKCLQVMNDELVKKQKEARVKKSSKHYGRARVLTVEELQDEKNKRSVKEAAEEVVKKRKLALRGKVGFAKLVWKELRMGVDVFEEENDEMPGAEKDDIQETEGGEIETERSSV